MANNLLSVYSRSRASALLALKHCPWLHRRLREFYYSYVVRYGRIERRVIKCSKSLVLGGPFAGMRYLDKSHGSRLLPKIIGCYESQLHPILQDIIRSGAECIVDIGAAEGYYAIGFALKLAHVKVFAFETSPIARELCRKLAERNLVADKIHLMPECTVAGLNNLNLRQAVVICDCEGAEGDLLDPQHVKWLIKATMIVELHDWVVPNIKDMLEARFHASHNIEFIYAFKPVVAEYAILAQFSAADVETIIDEDRDHQQQWALLRPKSTMSKIPTA